MTIRILADREPYSSFASTEPPGSVVILNGPPGLDDPSPDILVLPAEDFLLLRAPSSSEKGATRYIPYGPVMLMKLAFERGCEDYLREPWSLPELRARVIPFVKLKFMVSERVLELKESRLSGERASVELTESERAFLRLLVLNAPLLVPKEAVLSSLSHVSREETHALGRCASVLRRKMDLVDPELGGRLLAIRGLGYRLDVSSCG